MLSFAAVQNVAVFLSQYSLHIINICRMLKVTSAAIIASALSTSVRLQPAGSTGQFNVTSVTVIADIRSYSNSRLLIAVFDWQKLCE